MHALASQTEACNRYLPVASLFEDEPQRFVRRSWITLNICQSFTQDRNITSAVVHIVSKSDGLPIAPKQDRVQAASGDVRVAHALLQDRQIALAIVVETASDSLPIAPKQDRVRAASGDLRVAHALLQDR